MSDSSRRQYSLWGGIIALAALGAATVCVVVLAHRAQAPSLSLVFERYSGPSDFFIPDVAFLRFTNSSDKTYWLPMAGGTNTLAQDSPIGPYRASYLVDCQFSDQANTKPRVSVMSWGKCVGVAPHSAVRLRVPLPPPGQTRRVAVLCAEEPSGSPRRFWTHGLGLTVLRMLPRSVGLRLLFSQPAVLRVWCDRELSHPAE
jgi:hypothetical protein